MALRFQWLLVVLTVSACAIFLFAFTTHAQIGLRGTDSALAITFSPASPNPGDTLQMTLRSSLIDITESDILWQINGKTIAQGKGTGSASLQVGALGTETQIDVTVTMEDGATAVAHAVVIPTGLELLVDSDSYTPPFYRGRPRASAGTNLHLQAIPHFKRTGATLPAGDLIYTWRRNNQVLGSISGKGKSAAIIPVEHLFGRDTISVEAKSPDEGLLHTAEFSLSSSEPILTLYQDHPLYGILYHQALGASAFVSETEMTFTALPYFAEALHARDPALNFAWRVNGGEIKVDETNQNELTINAENSSGIAQVELEVTRAENYFLDARGAWRITFSSSGIGAADQFHPSNQ